MSDWLFHLMNLTSASKALNKSIHIIFGFGWLAFFFYSYNEGLINKTFFCLRKKKKNKKIRWGPFNESGGNKVFFSQQGDLRGSGVCVAKAFSVLCTVSLDLNDPLLSFCVDL